MSIGQDDPASKPEAFPLPTYWLEVQPDAPGQPWHATLEKSDHSERLEFDSPLELARHLVSLGCKPGGGLR